MMKNILITLVLLCTSFSYAKEMTLEDDMALTSGFVINTLNTYTSSIKNGVNGKPLPAIRYWSYSIRIQRWCKYPFFEADTGLKKEWILKVKSYFDYMGRCADFCEIARKNNKYDTPKTDKVKEKFVQSYDSLLKFIKKPDKLNRMKWRDLQRKKRDWLKVMRKKEKERLEKERYEKRRAR